MKQIQLRNQLLEVVKCEKCSHEMVNIDANEIVPGDLSTLKQEGVRLSNPNTTDPVCLDCEVGFRHALKSWWDKVDDNDDSGFFSSSTFGGGSSFGGFSSGGSSFGGFGGGSFSGGGASRSF